MGPGLNSHPKDRRSGGSILRSLDWHGSLACIPLHYRHSQPDFERFVNNQKTVLKSVKRYFGGMVPWEKIQFVRCVQQISESDCTAY